MSSITKIKEQLRNLGLTTKEASIYLDLLTNGNNSVRAVSQSTGINRITVHSAVEQLINKELIVEGREGNRRTLIANQPSILIELVKKRQMENNILLENAVGLTQLFEQLPRQSYSVPVVTVYKDVRGLKKLLEDTLSAKSIVRVMIDIMQFRELLSEEYLLNYYKRRAKKNINTRLIWPDVSFTKKIKANQDKFKMEIKTLKGKQNWKVGFFSWDDMLAIKSLTKGNLVCTLIKSKEIASFYQNTIFDAIWDSL